MCQLPPKPQPKQKNSTPLLKSCLHPGTEEKVYVVSVEVKEDLSLTATETALLPPPRPPKPESCSSAGELSPLSTAGKYRSKRTGRSERRVHFDPSLPNEGEPPPLPPRVDDIMVLSCDTTSVVPTGPPPCYCIGVEMAHLSDSSGDMEDGFRSDVTATTELGDEHDIILDKEL